MVTAKLAFVLIQVGSNLWVNPMQVEGIQATPTPVPNCSTQIAGPSGILCSDWTIDKIRKVLSPIAVSRAVEDR